MKRDLKEYWIKFATTFSNNIFFVMDSNAIFTELKVLQMILPNNIEFEVAIFEFVKVVDWYPNFFIDYRILLTILVTGASVKRSYTIIT